MTLKNIKIIFLIVIIISGIVFAADNNNGNNVDSNSFASSEDEVDQSLILGVIIVGLIFVALAIGGILVYANSHKEDIEARAANKNNIEDYVDEDNRRLSRKKEEKLEKEVVRRLRTDREFRKGSSFSEKGKKVYTISEEEAKQKAKQEVKKEILEKLKQDLVDAKKEEAKKIDKMKGVEKATYQTEKDVENQASQMKKATEDIAKQMNYRIGLNKIEFGKKKEKEK